LTQRVLFYTGLRFVTVCYVIHPALGFIRVFNRNKQWHIPAQTELSVLPTSTGGVRDGDCLVRITQICYLD